VDKLLPEQLLRASVPLAAVRTGACALERSHSIGHSIAIRVLVVYLPARLEMTSSSLVVKMHG
jgi:hypothetical protein